MMKKLTRLSFALASATLLLAAFAPDRWLYRQRITTAGAVTRVTLNRTVYDGADAGLADLRVVRDGTSEVPYLLSAAHAAIQTKEAPVRVVNKETRAGTLYATLELAASREPHNQLELHVTRDDFRAQLTLETSDDGRQWALVRQSAYIFRYRTDDGQMAEHTTLRYPDSRRRYLRLAIASWPDPEQFTGATIRHDGSTAGQRSVVWQLANPGGEARNRATCVTLDTGTRAPRDTVTIEVADSPSTFHRSVTLEQSDDGKSWSWLGAGAVYRIPGEESLAVTFPEIRTKRQRLCLFHGDDEPVRMTSVQLLGVDRVVTFRSEAPGTYWLYFGAAAPQPEYDLVRTAGEEFKASARPGVLADREPNPAYRAPRAPTPSWAERYPGVLYAALALAVAGLGWLALRLLRETP